MGLKLNHTKQVFYTGDPMMEKIYEKCMEYNKPIMFHAGLSWEPDCQMKYSQPVNFEEVAIKYPELRFCLAHFGWPWIHETTALVLKYANVYQSVTCFIEGDFRKGAQVREFRELDGGFDFYAPQTVMAPDGRRIMVGWMQSWDAKLTNDFCNWSGMMTLPRELVLKEGKIYQSPVRELESYRKNKIEYIGKKISETAVLEGIKGRIIDLQVDITEFGFHHFAIHFACNAEYEMLLQYNHLRKCLTIDRTHSGLVRDVVCRRKMTAEPCILETQKEVLSLRLLLDRYSAEVFLNGGEKVMSAIFHTPMEADGIVFDTDGTACINVVKYDICI